MLWTKNCKLTLHGGACCFNIWLKIVFFRFLFGDWFKNGEKKSMAGISSWIKYVPDLVADLDQAFHNGWDICQGYGHLGYALVLWSFPPELARWHRWHLVQDARHHGTLWDFWLCVIGCYWGRERILTVFWTWMGKCGLLFLRQIMSRFLFSLHSISQNEENK